MCPHYARARLPTTHSLTRRHSFDARRSTWEMWRDCAKNQRNIAHHSRCMSASEDMLGKRVLVVDDDTAILESIGAVLEMDGYDVSVATDGLEALDQVSADRPDLILLDLMMPRMDGYAFAAELRRRETLPKVPIVVLTADGRIRQKADRMGAEGFLSKPFDVSTLLTEVARLAG